VSKTATGPVICRGPCEMAFDPDAQAAVAAAQGLTGPPFDWSPDRGHCVFCWIVCPVPVGALGAYRADRAGRNEGKS